MEIVAEQQELAETIAWVARSLPHRPGAPVLRGVLLTATGDGTTIAGTDQAIANRAGLACSVDEPGTCLAPGRMLAEIVKLLPPGSLRLETVDNALVLTSGTATYALPLMPVEEFAPLPALPDEHSAEVEPEEFGTAVAQVAVSAGRDDVVPALSGINLAFAADQVELVSTDRYRLGIARVPLAAPVVGPFDVLVPAKPLQDLIRAYSNDPGPLRLSAGAGTGSGAGAGDATFGLRNAVRSTCLRVLSGPYLPYRRIIPDGSTTQLRTDRAALREVVKRLAVVAAGMTPIWFDLTGDDLRVHAGSPGDPTGAETLPAKRTGPPLTIAFTATLLADAISSFGTSQLCVAFAGARKPVLITGATADGAPAGDYRHVLTARLPPRT
ncbi:DNA polymerase III, beta subunit [Kribbella flavida DSM 17836]|uniref:DNA polymerase III, beta subunit n=1 Tax=Kribbella flavida (strain DSM 17836 / JCM 10339 / NBRC 14399) TaxID=479435 RepID=D2PYX2_KRIFD|nr:DNA polymerase III subunit beta [Kribbella flavida]ADB31766.1 DNA polymerase III, beta subunit [Kribbella flavida DSM 17836]